VGDEHQVVRPLEHDDAAREPVHRHLGLADELPLGELDDGGAGVIEELLDLVLVDGPLGVVDIGHREDQVGGELDREQVLLERAPLGGGARAGERAGGPGKLDDEPTLAGFELLPGEILGARRARAEHDQHD